jgi:alpha-1,6-mannosyltransferase
VTETNSSRRGLAWAGSLLAFVLAFPLGATAARLLLLRAPASTLAGLAAPLPVVTAWGGYGAWCFLCLAGPVALATGALVLVVRTAPARGLRFGTALVLALASLALGGAALFPFTFSSDPYAYAAYGEMAARGLNPYVTVAPGIHGATIDAARFQWSGAYPVCVYGPAFVTFARIADATARPFGTPGELALFRCSAAFAFLASIALLGAALGGLEPRRRFGILCAYGLNPVSLWSVAEGHNDALVLLAAAAAALLAKRGALLTAGLLVAASAALKATGAVLAVCFALDQRFAGGSARRGTRAGLGVAAGLVLSTAFALPPMLPALTAVGAHGRYAPSASLQTILGLGTALGLSGLAAAFGLVRLVRGERDGLAWLGLAAVAALPNLYPWYALWLAPLAIAAGFGRASLVLYGVTIFALIRYLPDATGNMTAEMVRAAALGALLPLVFAFARPPLEKAVTPS